VAVSRLVFHRAGEPVGDFRKAWRKACKAAKLPGLLFHDLRRSAVRNMDRAGVAQTVAMKVTGHKSPSMWRRYRITSTDEVRDALARTQTAIRAQREYASNVVALRPAADIAKA
jgi:integrase